MKDQTLPVGPWEFDAEVTAVFDDMLARSIPGYDTMREIVEDIALDRASHRSEASWLDIGASRGGAIRRLFKARPNDSFSAIESSPPMLEVLHKIPGLDVLDLDLRRGIPAGLPQYDFGLSVLTAQFVPIEYRHGLVGSLRGHCEELFFVEKVLGRDQASQDALVDSYHRLKAGNGYSKLAIAEKRRSLEGCLVPLSRKANEAMLEDAGWKPETIWANRNFHAWWCR